VFSYKRLPAQMLLRDEDGKTALDLARHEIPCGILKVVIPLNSTHPRPHARFEMAWPSYLRPTMPSPNNEPCTCAHICAHFSHTHTPLTDRICGVVHVQELWHQQLLACADPECCNRYVCICACVLVQVRMCMHTHFKDPR